MHFTRKIVHKPTRQEQYSEFEKIYFSFHFSVQFVNFVNTIDAIKLVCDK